MEEDSFDADSDEEYCYSSSLMLTSEFSSDALIYSGSLDSRGTLIGRWRRLSELVISASFVLSRLVPTKERDIPKESTSTFFGDDVETGSLSFLEEWICFLEGFSGYWGMLTYTTGFYLIPIKD
jgi:hypothetical protein